MDELKPDLALVNRDGVPILVAEVKFSLPEAQTSAVAAQLAKYRARYGLVATRDKVYLFDGNGPSDPVLTLDTDDIIRAYDVAGGSGSIQGYFLESLVAAWLLDLGQRLYPQNPPGYAELRRTGILDSLADTVVVRDDHS